MSRTVIYSELTHEEARKIEKDLSIKPQVKSIPGQKAPKEPDPIHLYKIFRYPGQHEGEEPEKLIHIPLFYAYLNFPGKCIQTSSPVEKNLEFMGSLKPNQETIYTQIVNMMNRSIWNDVIHLKTEKLEQNDIEKFKLNQPSSHIAAVLLKLSTGFGKTVLSIRAACELGFFTCVLCPNKTICRQWKDAIHEFTTSSCWDMTTERYSKAPPGFDFVVAVGTTRGVENNMPQEVINSVGTLIVDEAHTFCSVWGVNTMNLFQPYFLIKNTATPEREDQLHKAINLYGGPKSRWIHKINLGKISAYRIDTKFVPRTVPKDKNPAKCKTVDWHTMLESISTSDERNDIIVQKVIEHLEGRKAAIITWRIAHVDLLVQKFQEYGIDATSFCRDQSKFRDARVLVGTNTKMGIGFDEKSSCQDEVEQRINMIVIAAPFKNKERLQQVVGRGTRSNDLLVLDFVDNHNTCEKQWDERKKWYKKHATCYNEKGRKI